MKSLRTRSLCLFAGLAIVASVSAITGCSSPSQTQDTTVSPGNPLVPANTASATVGDANEKAAETQQQLDDLTGGDK